MPERGPIRYICYDFGGGVKMHYKQHLVAPYGWAYGDLDRIYWTERPISAKCFEQAKAKRFPTRTIKVGFKVQEPRPDTWIEKMEQLRREARKGWKRLHWSPETGWREIDNDEED